MMVKPISRAPFSAASNGRMPSSMWRTMFSSMTMASSTTKPTDSVSASSVMLLMEKSEHVHHREGAEQRDRHRQRRNEGRRRRAQEQEDHQDHEHRGRSAAFPRRRRPTGGSRSSGPSARSIVDRRRNLRAQRRQLGLARASTTATVLASGCLWIASTIDAVAVEPARDLVVLDAVDRSCATSSSLTGEPLRQATTTLAVVGRLVHLAGGLQRDVLLRPVQRADRRRGIGARRPRSRMSSSDSPRAAAASGSACTRIANFCAPKIMTCATPGICDSACPMRDVAIFVDRRQRQRRRTQRDEQHREVRRIDLAEARRGRHLDRQPALRDGQRGLHVERGGVDVAVEVELDGDRGGALRRASTTSTRCRRWSRAGARSGRRPRPPWCRGWRPAASR